MISGGMMTAIETIVLVGFATLSPILLLLLGMVMVAREEVDE